ncbi:hypothetical protein Tco_0085605 [Tanacetum coccineum]
MVGIGRILQCLTFIFLILTFSVLLRYLHFPRTLPFSVKTFLRGKAFWEWVPPFLNGNFGNGFLHPFGRSGVVVFWSHLSVRTHFFLYLPAYTPFSFLPNFVNTASLSESLCLGDSDPSRLILEKMLGVGSGLLDVLRECLDLRLLPCSPLMFGVLDLECCNTSWIFELLLEHPSKLRQAFTSFSLSCWFFLGEPFQL